MVDMEIISVGNTTGKYVSNLFSISKSYIAWSENNEAMMLSLNQDSTYISNQKIFLKGHHQTITYMIFVYINEEFSLVTASSDYIIIWHINEVFSSYLQGDNVRGHILCSALSSPHHIGHLCYSNLICYITDTNLTILDASSTQADKLIANLEVRDLSCAEFLDTNNIIAISYKGHITLINFKGSDILQEIIFNCNCSLTALSPNIKDQTFAVGSSIATMMEFAFDEKCQKYKPCLKSDLDENLMRFHEQWKRQGNGDQSRGHVLSMKYIKQLDKEESDCYYKTTSILLCATERAIFAINCENHNVTVRGYTTEEIGAPVVGQVQFSHTENPQKIYCAATGFLEAKFYLFLLSFPKSSEIIALSLVSNAPLLSISPLNSQSKLTRPGKPTNDKPVTFKDKIKSSGYAASPRMTMFKPSTSFSKKTKDKEKSSLKQRKLPQPQSSLLFSWDGKITSERIVVSANNANVGCLSINGDDQRLACAVGSIVHVGKLPLSNFFSKNKVISGNGQVVNGCSWSFGNDLLMTYSNKRVVHIWDPPYTNEAVLSFEAENIGKVTKDLVHSQFYYLDKFLLLGVGDAVTLYKYILSDGKKDDVERYLSKSKEKIIGKLSVCAQAVTCLTAPNSYYSYIVLACCSDRSLVTFDLNANTEVFKFQDVHRRPPHTICCALPSSSFSRDLFITSATSDGIKLWDLRSQHCVRKLHFHPCSTKCTATISNCGNFIASSTDNKSVFLYDIRKTFPLHEISTKSKVISLSFTSDSRKLIVGNDSSALEMFERL